MPGRQDPRTGGGDRDRELEVGGQRAVLGEDRPVVVGRPGSRGGRRSPSARPPAPSPPPARRPSRGCRSWGSADPRASRGRSRGRPASAPPTGPRPRRGSGSRGRCRRGGCRPCTTGTATISDSSVTRSSFCATGLIGPTGKVRAASATQPSSTTPMSTDRMSPRLSLYGPGIPWTIIELGEAQIDPGKAAVALERRGRALRADEPLGGLVELLGGDARADLAPPAGSSCAPAWRPPPPSARFPPVTS